MASFEGPNKGRAQNEQEVNVYTNPAIKPIVAQIYDFDSRNYEWLVSEVVRECSEQEFLEFFGADSEGQIWTLMEIVDPTLKHKKKTKCTDIPRCGVKKV